MIESKLPEGGETPNERAILLCKAPFIIGELTRWQHAILAQYLPSLFHFTGDIIESGQWQGYIFNSGWSGLYIPRPFLSGEVAAHSETHVYYRSATVAHWIETGNRE